MTPPTPDLAELRRLAATVPPIPDGTRIHSGADRGPDGKIVWHWWSVGNVNFFSQEEAELHLAARNALPGLLDRITELEAKVAEYEASWCDGECHSLRMDINRLASGDYRALHAENQWILDIRRERDDLTSQLAAARAEVKRLQDQLADARA